VLEYNLKPSGEWKGHDWLPDSQVAKVGCDLRGEQFSCEPEIHARNETYAALSESEGDGKLDSWRSWLHNHRWEPKQRKMVMKVLLMTKDEWPLIKSWVFYHAKMFGFNNLYIIDASENHECITFLTDVRANYGVNVIFSASNLNEVIKDINYVMTEISAASDLMIKIDTDEFLAVLPDTEPCSKYLANNTLHNDCFLTPFGVLEYIQEELSQNMDGSLLKIGYLSNSISKQSICESIDRGDIQSLYGNIPFMMPAPTLFKTVFDSRTYREVDLGSHGGLAWQPFNNLEEHPYLMTKLGIIHVHSTCYEDEMENNAKAVTSHAYVSPEDTDLERIEKLYKMIDSPPCHAGPAECCASLRMNVPCFSSCHKVVGYLNHLVCPEEDKQKYYENFASTEGNTNLLFRKYLEESALY